MRSGGRLLGRLLFWLVDRVIATAQAISPAEIDEPPPFWGRWSRIYWVVAGLLAAEILAFWLLRRWAA